MSPSPHPPPMPAFIPQYSISHLLPLFCFLLCSFPLSLSPLRSFSSFHPLLPFLLPLFFSPSLILTPPPSLLLPPLLFDLFPSLLFIPISTPLTVFFLLSFRTPSSFPILHSFPPFILLYFHYLTSPPFLLPPPYLLPFSFFLHL